MDDKKLHELSDEALDCATGGASYRFNEQTRMFDVFRENSDLYWSFDTEEQAALKAQALTNVEGAKKTKALDAFRRLR